MPIESPNLADLTFQTLREQTRRRIPVYAPEWTDWNDSDPGSTLIDLFCEIAEKVGWRLNQVPEKNYIELLKLLGIRLAPALPARTRLALLLANPANTTSVLVPAGTQASASQGSPPPIFQTESALDLVPCEVCAIVTTRNPRLHNPRAINESGSVAEVYDDSKTAPHWLSVRWDGKKPKLADMPQAPVDLAGTGRAADHKYVWLALEYNPKVDAGFLGVRVALTLQFDDDEQPTLTEHARCENVPPPGEAAPTIDWLWYFDAEAGEMRRVTGAIADSTERFTRSGALSFTVPATLGPIPESLWTPLRPASSNDAADVCTAFATSMGEFESIGPAIRAIPAPRRNLPRVFTELASLADSMKEAIQDAVADAAEAAASVVTEVPHPLPPDLRPPKKQLAWIRVRLAADADTSALRLRIASFNVVPIVNLSTVTGEVLGVGAGEPGQTLQLANTNIQPNQLDLAIQEGPDETAPLQTWRAADLDSAGPFDRVFDIDWESGRITFGSGRDADTGQGGMIPPLVPNLGQIVARRYLHGGGIAGNVGVAAIKKLETSIAGVKATVNFVAAQGGKDAETLPGAKRRARKEISSRSRAVTASDFQWIASQTRGVNIARVHVIPLRSPTTVVAAGTAAPRCGPPLPALAAGVDSFTAAGVVTVVVIPRVDGPEPTPTPSMLRAVAAHLDEHRLVTTEIYVAPPQFARLCSFEISVKAKAGYTRAMLQQTIGAALATYLHVLTGGPDAKGFPFGAQLHIADLIAQTFRAEGVERVDSLTCQFTRTKSRPAPLAGGAAAPAQGSLVICPSTATQFTLVQLDPDENVSFDIETLRVSTV